MKRFRISEETLSKVKNRANKLPLLKNSIRKGKGALVAYIGEEVVKKVLKGQIRDTYDYDITYAKQKRVDVKTKERNYPPKPNYNCTVADFNTTQDCDEYAFVTVLSDHSIAWYLGKISKDKFYKEAIFYKKGQLDPDSSPNYPFYFKADCYNIPTSKLEH